MASLLNNASFIFNPAGSIISYQEDKAYSVLPKDGTVDGIVSGNSGGGTRVNQYGYIETVPANIILNSQEVSLWATNASPTINANVATAPNGTFTADRITAAAAYASGVYQVFTSVSGQTYTLSVSVKNESSATSLLIGNDANPGTGYVLFNPTTGVITSVAGSVTASSVIDEGNGWYRVTITYVSTGTINAFVIYSVTSTVNSFFVWGAMTNIGSTAKPYQPTTDRLGYPPIDYKNGKGKILIEPQRTNLWVQSQTFTTYGLYRLTLTQNATTSPDGTQNAVKFVDTATTGQHQIEPSFSATSGQAYTVSVFAKAAERTQLHIFAFADNGVFNSTDAFYDLAAGTVISGTGASIEKWPNGWYRCIRTMTAGATGTGYWGIGAAVNGNNSYTGDGSSGIYMWGGQNEASGFPTSYIPTTSATVTRAVMDTTFNSPGPTKAFATKPGVILYDFDFYNFADGGSYETFLYNQGTTGGDYFYFAKLAGTGQIYWDGNNSGGYFYAGSFVPKQGKNRSAWYFTNSNSYWYVNGSLLYTGTYFDTTYFNAMQLNAVPGNNFAVNTFASIPNTSSVSQAQVQAWTNFNSGSGGTISYSGPFTIHTFTGSATFTPSFNGQVEVLIVAGGGGGGNNHAGGGGAGGLLYASSYGVSAGTGITVIIGAGGASPVSNPDPVTNGSNSVFGGLTAIGGGGGGNRNDTNNNSPGGNGGSGGGGGGSQSFVPLNRVPGTGIPGQGNDGGVAIDIYGGGGGGAGAVGTTGAASPTGGNGGDGLPYSISGFSTYYAGGGGGGYCPIAGGGNGGLGGGGKGGILVTDKGTPGIPYTGAGGGGGGAGGTQGSIGGAGIVIVRYLT